MFHVYGAGGGVDSFLPRPGAVGRPEVGAVDYGPGASLLVVDVQNDFAHPGGSLYVSGAEDVVAAVNAEVEEARAAGSPVFYTQDWHPPDTPHFAKDGGIWPVHCVAGSWGADFHPDLLVVGPAVRKGTGGEDGYSGFTMRHPVIGEERSTGLDDLLAAAGVERVVVVGLATDYCVKETGLDAVERGLATTVVRTAVAAVDLEPGDGDRALAELAAAGVALV
ncbi:bifunctional nicotinamidase/pyrazinamidase [soil metagenome]